MGYKKKRFGETIVLKRKDIKREKKRFAYAAIVGACKVRLNSAKGDGAIHINAEDVLRDIDIIAYRELLETIYSIPCTFRY